MYQLKLEGHCCSSIIIRLGLELKGEKDELFVEAARSLCHGMQSGLNCGALTAAVCVLGMFDSKNTEMTKDMVFWFQNELCAQYKSIDCDDITGGNPYNRAVICPNLVKETYLHAKQLLIDFGYLSI